MANCDVRTQLPLLVERRRCLFQTTDAVALGCGIVRGTCGHFPTFVALGLASSKNMSNLARGHSAGFLQLSGSGGLKGRRGT